MDILIFNDYFSDIALSETMKSRIQDLCNSIGFLYENIDFKDIFLCDIMSNDKIKEYTNIDKVHSLMTRDILSKGIEIAMGDLERRYNSMITNINNKAHELNLANEESRKTLDMDVEEKEAFKLAKNKEIELIEETMNGLTKAFEDIKSKWLEQNEKLKRAIRS